jgi:hypothetical protein
LEELRRTVKSSGAARALADAAVVRLAMSARFTDINTLIEQIDRQAPAALDTDGEPSLAAKKKRPEGGAIPAVRRSAPTSGAAATGAATSEQVPGEPDVRESAVSIARTARHVGAKPSPTQWERASQDPLVERVKAAVEGTLLGIKPATPPTEAGDAERRATTEEIDE